jgi:hypothetical protein
MLEGQYSNPVDFFAFNAAEEWVRDVSEYVACEIRIVAIDKGSISRRTSKHSWTVTKTETGGSSRCGSIEAADKRPLSRRIRRQSD